MFQAPRSDWQQEAAQAKGSAGLLVEGDCQSPGPLARVAEEVWCSGVRRRRSA